MVIDKVVVVATSIIKNSKGQVLMVQRSDKSSYPGFWQLVEGKLENEESPEEALKREIKEEVNLSVSQSEINSVFYNEIEAKGLKYLCFRIVFKTTVASENIKISDEHSSFGWFSKREILKLALLPGTESIVNKL